VDLVFKRFKKEVIGASCKLISQKACILVVTESPSSRSSNNNQYRGTFDLNVYKISVRKSEEK
jgi:hypothetical protein